LILEDDAEFCDDFVALFEAWYQQVPDDWDMLYLGGNHNGLKVKQVSEHVGRVTEMYATHAYAVRGRAIERIINRLGVMNAQVDVCYAELQKGLNAYCFVPLLAFQREGYSDVLNTVVNYDFELKRNQDKPLI
jgi:hypothetical protein